MGIGIGNGYRVAATPKCRFLGFSDSFAAAIRRKRIQMGSGQNARIMLICNSKKANLSASRKERIKLPIHGENDDNGGKKLNFSEFLSHPSGVEAVLNSNALQSYRLLDDNIYRCTLPKVQLLSFEAAPVLDLRVTPTNDECTVELLSCKFEGSDLLEHQSERFSAIMTNHLTWNVDDPEPFLEVDVKLNIILEISTLPFTMLPASAVEVPGNLVMQTLVDTLVPLLLQQLLKDYDKWVHQQLQSSISIVQAKGSSDIGSANTD